MNKMEDYQSYRNFIAERLRADSVAISDHWLAKLDDVVNEELRDIFPTEQYLDHIPSMIDEIALILEHAEEDMALANSLIDRKANELGTLRHQQKATVNQLLREYDLLSEILEDFVIAQTDSAPFSVNPGHGIQLMASVARIVRTILQSTVDSFVEKYMATIQEQTEKIISFNRFVSHELKTPLQAASLNIELTMEGRNPTDQDTRDLLIIQSSVQQASSLLQNIENLMQNTDAATLDNPVQQEVDLAAMLRDIESQLSESLDNRNVEIITERDLGSLVVETAKLKLVFTNLLTNAIKYGDPSKPARTVKIRNAPCKDTSMKCITVEDNGLGISEDMQQEVFKLRVRAHKEHDRENDVSGHGLGLYLVSEAMRDLGGSVAMESSAGVGTTVTLNFPLTPSPGDSL